MEDRLNAIANGHQGKPTIVSTARDEIPSIWGFSPRGLRKLTFPDLQRDVRANKQFYLEPLSDFKFKLEEAATAWANYHNLEPHKVRESLKDKVWPRMFDKKGRLLFSCTSVNTHDKRLLAWDMDWECSKNDRTNLEVAVPSKGDNSLISVFPCRVVLILDGVVDMDNDDENIDHFRKATELLELNDISEWMDINPFGIIVSTLGYGSENTVHLPISFILHTMQIALNIQNTNLMFHVIDGL